MFYNIIILVLEKLNNLLISIINYFIFPIQDLSESHD